MSTDPRGALVARTSAAGKAMNELTRQLGLGLGFAILLLVVYRNSEGTGVLLVALLLGVPLSYLAYRAVRAIGKELRLYEGGIGAVSHGTEEFFPWSRVRSVTGAVPVAADGQEGYLGGNLVVRLDSGASFYADEHFEGLDTFVKRLYPLLGAALVPEMCDAVRRGEAVDLGDIRATPVGLESAGTTIPWSAVTGVGFQPHTVRVRGGDGSAITTALASTGNAALLGDLVAAVRAAPPAADVIARFEATPASASAAGEEFRRGPAFGRVNYGGAGLFFALAVGFELWAHSLQNPPPIGVDLFVAGTFVFIALGFLVTQLLFGELKFVTSETGLTRSRGEKEEFVPWNEVVDIEVDAGGENTPPHYRIRTAKHDVWKFYGGPFGIQGHDRLFRTIKGRLRKLV